ncbi:MAG: response regulator [Rhodothermales bacterium]
MPKKSESKVILLAEDDADDRMLVTRVLEKELLVSDVRTVWNGEELMDYLHQRGKFEKPEDSPRPALILLDLNMPRKDGREALQEIKVSPDLRLIPVVVLTTSNSDVDVEQSYMNGANAYITKPARFAELAAAFKVLYKFWFEVVRLPVSA